MPQTDPKPYAGPTKLIVAFDIGVTFSGISYSILAQGRVPEIIGVTRFPGQGKGCGDATVPSLLYYDKSGRVRAAGAEVLIESITEDAQTEGWTKAERWMVHLFTDQSVPPNKPDTGLPPLPPDKSAVDVLAGFLSYLLSCTKTYIQERHLALDWTAIDKSIEYVFTHPNGREDVRPQYLQAIHQADLIPNTPEAQSRVHFVTEGEAILCYFGERLPNPRMADDAVSEGVAVISVGRSTIYSSAFSWAFNPFSCKEIVPTEYRPQGFESITRQAEILLKTKLTGWDNLEVDMSECMRRFSQKTCLNIKSDMEPSYLRVTDNRVNDTTFNVLHGRLKLSGKEATGVFDDTVNAIVDAFEKQLRSAKMPITTAFVVGELSANDWVWYRLRSYFMTKNVKIGRPRGQVNKTAANGAVLCRINDAGCSVRSLPAVDFVYPSAVSAMSPAKQGDRQQIRRKDQWEVEDYYDPDYSHLHLRQAEFSESFSLTRSSPEEFGIETVRIEYDRGGLSDSDPVNQNQSSFSKLCTIRVDLTEAIRDLVKTETPSGEDCYQLDYNVTVFFGLAVLEARVSWRTERGERRFIPAKVVYDDVPSATKPNENEPEKATM